MFLACKFEKKKLGFFVLIKPTYTTEVGLNPKCDILLVSDI